MKILSNKQVNDAMCGARFNLTDEIDILLMPVNQNEYYREIPSHSLE